jgi:hypothetical protein
VQLISQKLIAPVAGAMVVPCVVGLAGGGTASASNASATATPAPAAGATGEALVASQTLARDVLVGHRVTVAGALAPATGSQTIVLEQRARHGWTIVARSRSAIAGPFTLAFRPRRLGVHAIRVQLAGPSGVYDSPTARVNVFHEVLASWYGPGGVTACGVPLTATTLGVANKSLPCGTIVTLRYRHRVVRVPVIDRGPYVGGRDYDLTWATKEKLGASDLTMLWANH